MNPAPTRPPSSRPLSAHRAPWTRWLMLASACWVAAACATVSPYEPLDRAALNEVLEERGLDPASVVLPYRVDESMVAWARERVPVKAPKEEQLEALAGALLDPGEMEVRYSWGVTGTATDVFHDRVANCLAFTNLFLGLSRELDLPVYFLAVENVEAFRREGDLVVVSDHVAVGYGDAVDRKIFDFSDRPAETIRVVRRLADLTAIAMFHSNRGAESLQRGAVDDALDWLQVAVAIDPGLATAWVNYGVALRRAGQRDAAEAAYHEALSRDPRQASAYQNLASLLRSDGRDVEAEQFEQALARTPGRNPYTFLRLGDIHLRQGRLDEAERFYRRAASLTDADPEPYAALGQLAIAVGDLRQARRMLRKARDLEQPDRRTDALAAALSGG
ncbi:MAG: tetratricopeptide repeat protein [Acidobacteriota bacterium]